MRRWNYLKMSETDKQLDDFILEQKEHEYKARSKQGVLQAREKALMEMAR